MYGWRHDFQRLQGTGGEAEGISNICIQYITSYFRPQWYLNIVLTYWYTLLFSVSIINVSNLLLVFVSAV
jgi:hypothetical protein